MQTATASDQISISSSPHVKTVSVVKSSRRAQTESEPSRPDSAGSGADSPALVTTTLVAAPFITVTGDAGSSSRSFAPLTPVNPSSAVVSEGGTVAASETAVAAGVGTASYVQQQYVDGSTADTSLYTATTNGQMAYPAAVYAAINDGTVTMYTGDGGAFYTNGSQGQPVVTQGQLITAGNTYMIHQPRVEGADTHSLTMTTARGSQQTEQAAGEAQGSEQQTVTYMMATAPQQQQQPAGAAASSSAAEASDPLAQATRVSPATPSSAPPCPPLQPSPLVTEHTKVYIINNSAPPTGAAGRLGDAADPAAEEGDEDDPQEDDVLGLLLLNRVFGPTVQWLNDNYEVAEGVSLPRSTLYSHYLRHCAENKLDPVNAASFGKLIRQVFYGLRTRRLGTRGNSKYHYYGIRVKPESPLNNLTEEVSLMGRQSGGRGSRARREEYQDGNIDMHQTQVQQQYLGDSSSAVPNVPDIDLTAQTLPEGVTEEDVTNFTSIYREHCEVLLDAVVTLQFSSVEIIWQQFWRSANNSEDLLDDDPEKIMPKRVLHQLCDWPPVQDYVKTMDYLFYQNLVDVLIPDVLRAIPSTLTQAIRNFAKTLEGWLRSATESTPAGMVRVKLAAVAAFAQTLRRYTSLNHLAQAARAVLQNSGQISQMLADLNRVDFVNVQEQQQYLGDSSSAVPNVPDIDLTAQTLPEGVTEEDVTNFTSIYREHCEVLLDGRGHPAVLLGGDHLAAVLEDYVKTMDYLFYQNLVDVLIPDVLRAIPSTLTQAIRNFAKTLEGWLRSATESTPAGMVRVKLAAVAAFAQTLRRYTSLNHLAQAARAVLQNSGQISQMLADLNRVDFVNVQEQASWVCQCDDSLVQRLEADFKVTLQQQNSLEQWASWLEDVVTTVLKPFENKPEFPKAARQFLLKWSFYSSMVIRDLTLRSAASFGSFHLIRLLYDEYMFYLIENRVARATGEMPIAVMGDRSGQPAPQQPTQTAAERESAFDAPSELLLSNGPLLDGPLAAERGDGDVKRLRRE
ncbi:Transcription factor RFX3 [Amphibalanus amphitrite]|uniref:Transcription factor RFX3 n=1 Tax=Amphibalanus amphitrite TaxID=1232801 RepID=A0A6A4WZ62_AMPAM|nr:Transcription factor RFX3 [Amphibalanus amphitrite]